jgi:hypothetical protein
VWGGYLIFVILVGSGYLKNNNQNQRTTGSGYLKIFRIKEPLGLGIRKDVRVNELPVLGISKTSKNFWVS